jgi:iron complex outermembrane receptor protein
MKIIPLFLLLAPLAVAQQSQQPIQQTVQQTILVTGTPEPIMLAESPRAVVVLDTKEHPLAFETPEDYLRTDPSTFIEQRGAGGAQSDISIRGASFEQTLVLINGLRINDAQTSHHNLDLPIPLESMRTIEILHGAGSTLYGSDALGGVINFLTATPSETSLTLRAGTGSFGENEQSILANYIHKRFSEQLTATRNFSTGFIPDRDYRNETASSETRFTTALGTTDILLAGSDRAFGADQFYGPYNSWERTKGWFSSISQELGAKTQAAFGYRRHADNFILLRNDPSYYANNHNDASWQAVLRRHDAISKNATLAYGLEADGDSIDSNNLGIHARNRGAGYLNLDLRTHLFNRQATLSAGAREEILSGGARSVFSPDLAGSLWLTPSLKARASAGYGFRLPTYTDLYYTDPTTIGNPNLKPESAWSADGGLDWYANSRTAASLTVFYSRQHDAIDYIRANATQPWQATNLTGLRFTGVEASLLYQPAKNQTIKLAWTAISGAQKALHGFQSEYIFNYPVNNASFEYTAAPKGILLIRTRVGITQRYQADPYPVWDTELTREHGRIRPYLRMANLSNTGYEEIEDIPMPGRSFTGGIEFSWPR